MIETSIQSTTSSTIYASTSTTMETSTQTTTSWKTETSTQTTISSTIETTKQTIDCSIPIVNITSPYSLNFGQPTINKLSDLLKISSITLIQCPTSYSSLKEWLIYKVDGNSGESIQPVEIKNNPTLNYAELVLKPNTLQYGLYKFQFTLTLPNQVSAQAYTYVKIVPSGLILSTLSLSQPMYGGSIEITRSLNQSIGFNPFLFTYDIDSVAITTSLTFKYTCQIIDSNVEKGYPISSLTNQTIYLNEIKQNSGLKTFDQCFNSTGKQFNFKNKLVSNNLFKCLI